MRSLMYDTAPRPNFQLHSAEVPVPRQNVRRQRLEGKNFQRQNVRRHKAGDIKSKGQNVHREKFPEGQNVQRDNCPEDQTSMGTKRPEGYNVQRDKTSFWLIFKTHTAVT